MRKPKKIARSKPYVFFAFAFILIVFFCTGCYDSINPISQPQPGMLDERILGTWYLKEKGKTEFIHIGQTSRPGMIFIITVEGSTALGIRHEKYIAHGSRLGNATYLNIHQYDAETQTNTYLFVKYRVEKDTLIYSITDPAAIEADIKNNKLSGEMTKDHPVITADSKEIALYLKGNDDRLFHNGVLARRVELPDTVTEIKKDANGEEKPKDK